MDEGTLRSWLFNLGQLDAESRTAHFFCEMLIRLQQVGLAEHNSYDFPLTQSDISDVLGLSGVHMNRTLQSLREANLIVLKQRRLTIPNVDRLKAYCAFDPLYLHLAPRKARQMLGF